MRIAIAQIGTDAGDFQTTGDRIVELSRRASSEGADLLVLPLAAVSGQGLPETGDQNGFALDLQVMLNRMCGEVACPCIVPVASGMNFDDRPDVMYVRNDGFYPLRFLSYLNSEEEQCVTFEHDNLSIAVAFDYDDFDALEDSDTDVDLVLFLARRGFALDDPSSALGASLAENRFRDEAWALDAWIVGVGSLGTYDLQVFTGSSFVLTPRGELVACAPAFEEAFFVAEVGSHAEEPPREVLQPELYDRSLHLWESLVLGLRDHLSKEGVANVVLALDGRLDSSVMAALATDAVGPTHVHALVDSVAGDGERLLAEELARALRVTLHDDFAAMVPPNADASLLADLTQLRLAEVARAEDALVLSCADKTACALEVVPCSCNAATLAPLGDVYRTDVMRLGRLRNTISPVIASESLRTYDVPRVAGLDEAAHTPEARLELVDVTLATYLEWGRSITDVVERHENREVCEGVLDELHGRHAARSAMPPCIVVSSCTLREAELPFGMVWRDRIRPEEELINKASLERAVRNLDEVIGGSQEGRGAIESEMTSLLERLHDELAETVAQTPGDAAVQGAERQVGELLGLIRDILQSGGTPGDVPFGPLTWGSPFSEN